MSQSLRHLHRSCRLRANTRISRKNLRRIPDYPEQINHEQISLLAYAKWERRGNPPGDELADWLAAEQELRDRKEM